MDIVVNTAHLQVGVSYCVTGLNSNCDLRVSGQVRLATFAFPSYNCSDQVRACVDERESQRSGVFYVYRLVNVPTSCQWGYCAYSNYDGPT